MTPMKSINEINQCPIDQCVILITKDRKKYIGNFKGMDGKNIMLQSTLSNNMLGFPKPMFIGFYKQEFVSNETKI